jgi:ergothioneine biosynthesis protein EgtB
MEIRSQMNDTTTVENLKEKMRATRLRTEALCTPLVTEDYGLQCMPDVSPPKWHLAHVTWFFENFILVPYLKNYRPFDVRFFYLFNSYYESQGKFYPRTQRGFISRPTVDEVLAYRHYIDVAMDKLPDGLDAEKRKEVESLLTVGIQHEKQHQELLVMDVKYNFFQNPIFPAYQSDQSPLVPSLESRFDPNGQNPELGFVHFEGGLVWIGGDESFCYDNERPRHQVFIPPFDLATRLVTNGEFLEFIRAGGYENPAFWFSEGFAWATANQISHPLYWVKVDDGNYKNFTLEGLVDLNLQAPVAHLSYFEASAFATWMGMRLPTEFEWEHASLNYDTGLLWEWTSSPYSPYPGFKPFAGDLGEYNGKFMCNQQVLRGGCFASPDDHIRPSYRNFFPATSRWAFTGLRLAKD